MRTIAFLNKKGGVGKSSTVHHLGGTLARRGLKILLVDADPQSSLTQGLLGPDATWALGQRETIAALFGDGEIERVVRPLSPAISLLPGSPALDDHNELRPWRTGDDQYVLRNALREIGGYDLALIDCPPQIDLCSWNALVAAQSVVVPLQAEDYASQGIPAILGTIDRVKVGPNPGLDVLGYLLTMHQRTLAVHTSYEATIRSLYGDAVFSTTVPLAKDFKEAVVLRKPVVDYKPRSVAAKAMEALADEMLGRLGMVENKKVA